MTQSTEPMVIDTKSIGGAAFPAGVPTARPRVVIATLVSGAVIVAGLAGLAVQRSNQQSSTSPASMLAVTRMLEQSDIRAANQLIESSVRHSGISVAQVLENSELAEANALSHGAQTTHLTAADLSEAREIAEANGLSLATPVHLTQADLSEAREIAETKGLSPAAPRHLTEADIIERRQIDEANALSGSK